MKSSDWKRVRLGELVSINSRSISINYPYDEIEYIDTSSVTMNKFAPSQKLKLIEAPSRARRIVHHGDIIISTVRPIQKHFGYIQNPKPNTIVSTGFAVLSPISVHPEFLYYLLSQDSITDYLNGIAETSTTTFPAFRPEVLTDLEIEIPADRKTQERISNILSRLDEKIELNRQTNATLEAIAQAIFKEWFVDFNFPGATGEKVESQLGMIPKGWRMGKLGDVVDVVDCLHSKKPERVPEKTNYILLQLWNISDTGLLDLSDPYWISEQNYKMWISRIEAEEGLIVITNVGRVGVVARIPKDVKAALGRNMTALKTKNDFLFDIFLILLLKSDVMRNEIELKTDAGTILDSLNVRNIPLLRFAQPPSELVERFESIVKPIWEKLEANLVEIHTLAEIRDSLLPKLMNGQIKSREEGIDEY